MADCFCRFTTYLRQTGGGCYGATGLPKGFGKPAMDNSRHLVETQPHPAAAQPENKTQEKDGRGGERREEERRDSSKCSQEVQTDLTKKDRERCKQVEGGVS